jgi:hypothetical protein
MAKFNNGINGAFSGKVGTVVGSTWMGMPVMRGLPRKRSGGFSPKELQQQAKFSMLSKFLKPLIPMLNITFKQVAVQMTGFNKSFSYNVKNAFAGTHPDLTIDFSMVLLGRGDLPNVVSSAVRSEDGEKIIFSWNDNTGKGKSLGSDKVFIAMYFEEDKKWIYKLDIAKRSEQICSLNLSDYKLQLAGSEMQTVHTYIGLISTDEKDATDTFYAGLPIHLVRQK